MKKASMVALALTMAAAIAFAAPETGKSAPDFTLPDVGGTEHNLSDFQGRIVVLEWTNYDCPFVVKHYKSENMQKLQGRYAEHGVAWLSVCSSAPGKQGHFEKEVWEQRIVDQGVAATAVLLDPDGKVGRLYNATTTPHMFVIDGDGILRYQGAIDDKPSFDPATLEGARNHVVEAIEALLDGKDIEITETKPYGCSVKY